MAKRNQDVPHWSLEGIRHRLGTYSPPKGDFDPEGRWGINYIIFIDTKGTPPPNKQDGYVKMQRNPASSNGMVDLQIEQSVVFNDRRSQLTKASIQCKTDKLATPVSWQLESVGSDTIHKNTNPPKFKETAVVQNNQIIRTGKRTRRMNMTNPFTHDWALFDAIQRLKGDKSVVLEFDMLEDFDLLRPRQKLTYHGTIDVRLGGKQTRLIGYQQIGEGVLPIHYWLDEQYRLLFAIGGCRIYIYDSEIK